MLSKQSLAPKEDARIISDTHVLSSDIEEQQKNKLFSTTFGGHLIKDKVPRCSQVKDSKVDGKRNSLE